jgi:hypothetical protein
VNPATGHEGRLSRGSRTGQRSSLGSGLKCRVVSRRGLFGIEGFAVRIRFEPDCRIQRPATKPADRRRCQLLLEPHNPLESVDRLNDGRDGDAMLH